MEEIKPKKERKFLKAMGDIALTLFRELVLSIGKKVINKVGNKRQWLVITFVILASTFAIAQFPNTLNKQRLGFQTTADGLVWRGSISDTSSIQPINNQNAWVILDTINLKFYSFDFTSNVWNLVGGAQGLTMPFDSITFNTAKNGTVGVGEVEYNDTQGSLIQGLKGGNVTNVIGQQLHQRVNNRTGATLNKGDVVYLSGSQGNRITVAKGLAVTDAFSANTFGVVAESIPDNQSGFIITEGLITGLNTSTLTEDSAVYLSPTVAGALTSTKPQAPQHTVYIGVCVKSNNGSGELFVKIRNGQELDELHDTRISNPVSGATLYYSGGLWRDTTAALLVSDTASMLSNYATKAYADTTGRLYARQDYTTGVTSSTLTWTQNDTLIPGGVNVVQVYRNGQILLPSQYTIPTSTSVVIAASSFKVNDNYTVIFPRGGGAGSGGGSGSLTSISAGTGITVSPNPITTTGTVSADLTVLMELTDTTLLNLTTRFATKQNNLLLTTTGTSGAATLVGSTLNIPQYSSGGGSGTVTSVATGYGLLGGPITTTGTLTVDTSTVYNFIRDSIVAVEIGGDTIKILKQEYTPATSDTLTWTVTTKFPIQLRQFILLFRNGQLLLNDQFSIIDTNKVKVAASSFKLGENYTLVTVSGIGSVSSGQGNPVYPEAGIALSTGTTWTTSITNNSSNWNTAFTDRLKWDGGSTGLVPSTGRTSLGGTTIGQSMFTLTNPSAITFPRFNADNTVDARTAANFRSDIGAGTVTSVNVAAGTPMSITNNTTTPEISIPAATGSINGYLTSTDWTLFNNKQNQLSGTGFVKASGTSITYDNSTYLTTGAAASTYLPLTGGTLTGNLRLSSSVGTQLNIDANDNNLESRITFSTTGSARSKIYTTSSVSSMTFESIAQASAKRGFRFISSTEGTQYLGLVQDPQGNVGIKSDATGNDLHPNTLYVNGTLGVTGNITEAGNNVLTNLDTASLSSRIDSKQNALTLTTTGTSGAATFNGSTLNIPNYTSGSGTVTSVSGTGAISVANPTTTPVISVADAAFGTAGIVTASGTQQFSGDKVFEGITQFNARAVFKDYTYVATRLAGLSSTDRFATVTIGSGLSLVSGTLSATGGTGTVTNVTGTLPISVTNGTTTPSITIADAGTGASGVVNTGTQSFAGNKTFTGTVTLNSATGTATSVIGRSSTGQVVGVSLNTGLGISGGSLSLDFKTVLTIGTDFPSTNAQSSSDLTFTVTGASVGQPVLLGVPDGSAPANTNYTAWVSATNTVKIRFNNYSASVVNPAAGDFTIRVLNL